MNGTSLVNGNGHLKYSANSVDNDTNLNGTNSFGNENSMKMATNGHMSSSTEQAEGSFVDVTRR